MYRKAVCSYFSTINSVLECFMTQEICDQVVDVYFLVFDSIPDRYKTQQMRDRVVCEDSFLTLFCLDKYITQKCVMKLLLIL